ncbi:MAG TPA: hypothetical protein VGG03_03595 [Thermoanaerobaculia bacterium]|jgi:hypothetical protein
MQSFEAPRDLVWPTRLHAPGDHPVEVTVTCVLTRFGLRTPLHLLLTYLDYRRTRKRAARVPGLLRTAFLVEGLTTCYNLSLWADPDDIAVLGRDVPEHVDAARRVFGRLAMSPRGGPELWSTKWRLTSVSNNLNWEDLDLRSLILAMETARA